MDGSLLRQDDANDDLRMLDRRSDVNLGRLQVAIVAPSARCYGILAIGQRRGRIQYTVAMAAAIAPTTAVQGQPA